jgi:serine/threonine-protein kinase
MPSEESRQLRAIYAAALQRDPEERDEYLDNACVGQPELRAKVAALLQAHSKDFLDTERTPSLTRTVAAASEEIQGKVIGPYIVRRELGRGGMGVVYLVDDTRLSRPVALKALTPEVGRDHSRRERLRLEARAAAALSHPGIATVYALEEIGDDIYLSYEYVPGETLRALLASGPLPIARVVTIGTQLARALAAAHTAGVTHRDIKPENVMRTPSGGVKILDFGLARMEGAISPKLTQSGMIVGTPAYMAPEQFTGASADPRTDVFSIGVIAYEMLSGNLPFGRGTLADVVLAQARGVPAMNAELIPAAAERTIRIALDQDPDRRPASPQAFATQLDAAMDT